MHVHVHVPHVSSRHGMAWPSQERGGAYFRICATCFEYKPPPGASPADSQSR